MATIVKFLLPILFAALVVCNAAEVEEDGGKNWALLVAGSSSWWNYRHQADIAHAYKILRRRGFPASNIIVMMYDDVAHDSSNPTKGKLFNRPGGPDVYKGIKIDYKGGDVTPENFLAVLSGNKKGVTGGTRRVIQSGPKDTIFVNFADHGGAGVLCFPDSNLNAKDLINTLKSMTQHKKYAKLLLYIEACEAGSNFDGLLPHNTNILANTASASDESSWGWYCTYKSYPCLGDLYSIKWMEHMDKKIPANENLFDQYQTIRHLTTKSHVQLYGDFRVGGNKTNVFIGPHNVATEEDEIPDAGEFSGVPSRDVALHYFKRMAKEGHNRLERIKYSQMAAELEQKREFVDKTVDTIVKKVADNDKDISRQIVGKRNPFTEESLECHIKVYEHFSKKCFNLNKNQYVLKHFYKFANMCHLGSEFGESAIEAINAVCHDDFPVIVDTA